MIFKVNEDSWEEEKSSTINDLNSRSSLRTTTITSAERSKDSSTIRPKSTATTGATGATGAATTTTAAAKPNEFEPVFQWHVHVRWLQQSALDLACHALDIRE